MAFFIPSFEPYASPRSTQFVQFRRLVDGAVDEREVRGRDLQENRTILAAATTAHDKAVQCFADSRKRGLHGMKSSDQRVVRFLEFRL